MRGAIKEQKTARELEAMVHERLGEDVALKVINDRSVGWVANVVGPAGVVLRYQMHVETIARRLRGRFDLRRC